METLLILLGIFVTLVSNAIAYSCFRYFLIKSEFQLEERVNKKCGQDKASFEGLKTEIKGHLDKITREVKSLQREVERLKAKVEG